MTDPYRELLLGCGHARDKRLGLPNTELQWRNLTTLDRWDSVGADWVCDLDEHPWEYWCLNEPKACPAYQLIPDNTFDEVHAYEVLEHLGRQGDADSFFDTFREIHRILKPGGYLFATTPSRHSPWLWGDPSHRRAIIQESLVFLDQRAIHANRMQNTAMSDFSAYWTEDFEVVASSDDHVTHLFCLKAHKPARTFGVPEHD